MKLQSQFTIPKKDIGKIDYLKKHLTLEKTLQERYKFIHEKKIFSLL